MCATRRATSSTAPSAASLLAGRSLATACESQCREMVADHQGVWDQGRVKRASSSGQGHFLPPSFAAGSDRCSPVAGGHGFALEPQAEIGR
jgi:hypothetical protein